MPSLLRMLRPADLNPDTCRDHRQIDSLPLAAARGSPGPRMIDRSTDVAHLPRPLPGPVEMKAAILQAAVVLPRSFEMQFVHHRRRLQRCMRPRPLTPTHDSFEPSAEARRKSTETAGPPRPYRRCPGAGAVPLSPALLEVTMQCF